ncbi:unknown [Akkermansia muciniphila CAG:154]|nr:unknown [Akkermansia muciniphila CAG:154]
MLVLVQLFGFLCGKSENLHPVVVDARLRIPISPIGHLDAYILINLALYQISGRLLLLNLLLVTFPVRIPY